MMFGGVAIPQGHSTWRSVACRRNPRGWYLTKPMAQYRSNQSQSLTNHAQRATKLYSLHLHQGSSCLTRTVTCWPSIDNLQQLLTQPWPQEKESSSQAVRSGSSRVDTTRPHRPNHPGSTSDDQDSLTLSGFDDGGIATICSTNILDSSTTDYIFAASGQVATHVDFVSTPHHIYPFATTLFTKLNPSIPSTQNGQEIHSGSSSLQHYRSDQGTLTSFPPITTLSLNLPPRTQLPRHRNPLGYTPRISSPFLQQHFRAVSITRSTVPEPQLHAVTRLETTLVSPWSHLGLGISGVIHVTRLATTSNNITQFLAHN